MATKLEISELDLLERAGGQVFNWMHTRMQGSQVKIHIFNGIGNNGGVGLVLARHLLEHGYNVANYVVNYSKKRTNGFLKNYDRVKSLKQWPVLLTDESEFPSDISPDDIIVDSIFGIGLNRDPGTLANLLFAHLNKSKAFKLAIDIPSGLYANNAPDNIEHVLSANFTLSFQSPKMAFFLPETAVFTEQWEVLDIGLDQEFLFTTQTEVELIGKHEVIPNYIPREKYSHKGQFGHALIIGGSYGKIGAVTLTSKAVLSIGAGLVSAYVPKCGYIPLQSSFPEAMVITDIDEEIITSIKYDIKPTVIAFGIGVGTDNKTITAFCSYHAMLYAIGSSLISFNSNTSFNLSAITAKE